VKERLHDQHFSLAEAQNVLTRVHALVRKLVELKQALDKKGWNVYRHQYFGGRGPNGDRPYPPEVDMIITIARQFDTRGVLLRDMDRGLIDFPHIRLDGEEVYLCWKLGEDNISYWHRVDEGFAGRRHVSEL
jgi:hypothetical protein